MEELKTLFLRAQAGDLDAYGEIVRRFQDMAVGYAYAILGDFHLAEDAAQETFIEAYSHLERLYSPFAFPAWLRKIIFKHCDRLTRGRHYQTVPIETALELASAGPDPSEAVEANEMKDRVREAIQGLPEHERRAVTLFYIADHSQDEIAAFLGVPVTTVKKRLHDARKRLRERIMDMVQETLSEGAPSRDKGFTKKVLEGVQAIRGESALIGSLYPMLKAAGAEWSVARLAGTFGHAFNFIMNKGGAETWQQGNIDWHEWWDQAPYLGYKSQDFQAILKGKPPAPSPEALQRLKDETWKAVKASIDRGVPAMAWQPMTVEQKKNGVTAWEWGLIVGYDEADRTYTIRHPYYANKDYTVPYDQFGYTDPVNWYYVMVLETPRQVDRVAGEIQSLKHAVAFAHGKRYDLEIACYRTDAAGFAAYELWREAFRDGSVDLQFAPGHALYLRWARECAAQYLREIVGDFSGKAGQALSRAAAFYEQEVEAAAKLIEVCRRARDHHKGITASTAQEANEALSAALDADRKAVGEIEAALAALPVARE